MAEGSSELEVDLVMQQVGTGDDAAIIAVALPAVRNEVEVFHERAARVAVAR